MPRNDESYAEVTATLKAQTAKAVLLNIDGQEHWIARSLLAPESAEEMRGAQLNELYQLDVPEWWALEKGL